MYRQGDVLIERIDKITLKRKTKGGKHILVEGEATGHHHAIEDETTVVFHGPKGEIELDVTEHTELTHQEHDTIPIEPGTYKVIRQRQEVRGEIRNVLD